MQQAIEAVNRLFFLSMPVVVLCFIWPQIDRIENKIESVEKQVHATEKKVDAIEHLIKEKIGEELWQRAELEMRKH